MGSLTNYAETALVNHMLNSAYTPVATVYLALATASPGESATGASMSEVPNSGSYARTAISFGAASSRRVTQSSAVVFPTATGSWGTVTSWAIVDSPTHGAGNVLAYGGFATSKSIVSGNTPTVSNTTVWVELTASTGLSNYFTLAFLDLMFRNQAFGKPDTYLGYTTVAITDTDTGSTVTEPSGNGYSRIQVNEDGGSSPTWNTASAGSADNADQIDFDPATGSQGTMVHLGIFDASTAGNLLGYCDITDQAVGDGDQVQIAAGALVISQA